MRCPNSTEPTARSTGPRSCAPPGRRPRPLPAPRTRFVSCVFAFILATSACGHHESTRPASADRAALTGEEQTAVASIRKAERNTGSFVPGKEGCLATGLVRDLGVKELQAAGLLDTHLRVPRQAMDGPLSMSKPDANTVADVTLRCMNWRLIAMHLVDDQPSLYDKYDRACIATITRRDVRELIVNLYSNPNLDVLPPLYRELERAGCGFEGDG